MSSEDLTPRPRSEKATARRRRIHRLRTKVVVGAAATFLGLWGVVASEVDATPLRSSTTAQVTSGGTSTATTTSDDTTTTTSPTTSSSSENSSSDTSSTAGSTSASTSAS